MPKCYLMGYLLIAKEKTGLFILDEMVTSISTKGSNSASLALVQAGIVVYYYVTLRPEGIEVRALSIYLLKQF